LAETVECRDWREVKAAECGGESFSDRMGRFLGVVDMLVEDARFRRISGDGSSGELECNPVGAAEGGQESFFQLARGSLCERAHQNLIDSEALFHKEAHPK
jgi:hypothetical protein